MHWTCRLGRHRASAGEIWNDGHFFSFCTLCGCDVVRRPGEKWRRVRPPMKVVWRARRPHDMAWIARESPPPPPRDVPVAPEWRQRFARGKDDMRRDRERQPALH